MSLLVNKHVCLGTLRYHYILHEIRSNLANKLLNLSCIHYMYMCVQRIYQQIT